MPIYLRLAVRHGKLLPEVVIPVDSAGLVIPVEDFQAKGVPAVHQQPHLPVERPGFHRVAAGIGALVHAMAEGGRNFFASGGVVLIDPHAHRFI